MILRQRRFLPNLSLLMAFDALMRRGSVTEAAHDLSLTQSTVSRLIQSLEAQLGQTLFIRHRKRLLPTEAAERYFLDISRALDLVERSSMSLVTNPQGGTLELAVLPTFGTRWLAPRLAGFLLANPGISVNLATRFRRFNFDTEPFDAVIYFGFEAWPGASRVKLFDERLTACASPEFLRAHPIKHADDFDDLVLLQLETRPSAWEAWFLGQGMPQRKTRNGMMMDQFSMMIQAALAGLGIALLPDYLAQIEIGEGRLRPVLKPAVSGSGAYWLAWPKAKDEHRPITGFRSWLLEQTLSIGTEGDDVP